jgi:hypothetical protein
MSQTQPGKPEREPAQVAPLISSTAVDPAAVAVPHEQPPALPEDHDASAPRRFSDVIRKMVHELRPDLGHAISLIALHVVALGILEKTPVLALLTLR